MQLAYGTVAGSNFTPTQTYARQQFTAIPYALQVPVDGSTLTYDSSSGNLQVGSVDASSITGAFSVLDADQIGIGTASPAADLSFDGTSAHLLQEDRNSIANASSGYSLTVGAGGASSGASNQNGGDLVLASGIATGSGSSSIQFQTSSGGSSGTGDTALSTVMTIQGKQVGIDTAPSYTLDVAVTGGPDGERLTGSGVGGPWLILNATNATVGNRYTGMLLQSDGTNQWEVALRAGDGKLHLSDLVNGVDRITVDSAGGGEVGINNAAPGYNLDVTGNVNVTGHIFANGVQGLFFGGTYEYYMSGNQPCVYGETPKGYRYTNPMTGGYSCPAGYTGYEGNWTYDGVNTNCTVVCYY